MAVKSAEFKKGYVVMRLQRQAEIRDALGEQVRIRVDDPASDVLGFLPVFRTKTAARKVYGRKARLQEIEHDITEEL